jgi:hypothetical protein
MGSPPIQWITVARERQVVTALGRGIEVGVSTAVSLLWFPVGTVIRACRIDSEIISSILVACRTRKFQHSQRS